MKIRPDAPLSRPHVTNRRDPQTDRRAFQPFSRDVYLPSPKVAKVALDGGGPATSPLAVAQGLQGQDIYSVITDSKSPLYRLMTAMDDGKGHVEVQNNCANFVTACYVAAGALPKSALTTSAPILHDWLTANPAKPPKSPLTGGWLKGSFDPVPMDKAQPGDIVFVKITSTDAQGKQHVDYGHVMMFDHLDSSGAPQFTGANNDPTRGWNQYVGTQGTDDVTAKEKALHGGNITVEYEVFHPNGTAVPPAN